MLFILQVSILSEQIDSFMPPVNLVIIVANSYSESVRNFGWTTQ